jgi:SsrA-binding protein
MKKEKNNKVSIQNRKASFEYNFIEKFEAGIVLIGTEVKSIRENGANISDAYCYVNSGEMFIKNMHISHLKNTKLEEQHEPLRERKLLLNKKEIRKISNELKNQGLTVVPVSLYTNDRGRMKINIALSKGKKLFDKRNQLKEKQIIMDSIRELKR